MVKNGVPMESYFSNKLGLKNWCPGVEVMVMNLMFQYLQEHFGHHVS
jgi:hypothetical protein